MSMPHGTYINGIRCVETLKDRCFVDKDTGCWHWRLAMDSGLCKVHFVTPDTGTRTSMRGRRAALYLCRGHDVPDGHVAWAAPVCKSGDCVNPEHAVSGDRFEHGAYLRATGISKVPAKRRSAVQTARRHRSKLDAAKANEIRNSSDTIAALAGRYGVSNFCIWSVKVGKTWKAEGSSVFSWAGAQARRAA